MSNLLPRTMGIVVLLMALLPLRAQETKFYVEDVTAEAGGNVSVSDFANGLADVVGLQLSLNWDTLLLDFSSVSDVVLDGTLAGNFNQTQLDNGRVGYLEVDESLAGFGLPDSTRLFTMNFISLKPHAAVTELTFGDAPLRFSAMDNQNNRLDCEKDGGTITLEGTNGVSAFAEDPRFQVAPNPFREFVRITTRLNYGGKATLELLDLKGRLVHRRELNLIPGEQTTRLSSTDFPATGAYIIRLVTDREQLHRKVVLASGIR